MSITSPQLMKQTRTPKKRLAKAAEDVFWISETCDVPYPLDEAHPIFIRDVSLPAGKSTPQPTIPSPERHSYCEVNFNLEGVFTQFIGGEKIERHSGDIMLLGPGDPHWAIRHSGPHRTITIYILPLVLFEMGPNGDGAWMLSRFTKPTLITQRVVAPPRKLSLELSARAQEMVKEFENPKPGSELRLLGLLMGALVDLLRWEASAHERLPAHSEPHDWGRIEKALRYIHQHYAEPVYVDQIALAVGITANRLRTLFRQALAMSISHYVQSLRVAQAKTRLCLPNAQVTDVAHTVGFETLSHFNTSFRKLTGKSPSQYMQSLR